MPEIWSLGMDNVFRACVSTMIFKDPRTVPGANMQPLGYPFLLAKQVTGKGLANFQLGYDDGVNKALTSDDLALLYAFIYFKGHFYSCLSSYKQSQDLLAKFFSQDQRPLILDFGCGPGTACLALADLFKGQVVDYIGIDSSPAMRALASKQLTAAKAESLFDADSSFTFKHSWTEVDVTAIHANTPILLLFSFFFASHTLTPALGSLCGFVERLKQNSKSRITGIQINSTTGIANVNYHDFRKQLGLSTVTLGEQVVKYSKSLDGNSTGEEKFVFDQFQLKGTRK